jgi:hypothetical protein
MDKDSFSKRGFFASVVAWFLLLVFTVFQSSCAQVSACGGFDLLIFGVVAVGLIAPAYFFGLFISTTFPDEK